MKAAKLILHSGANVLDNFSQKSEILDMIFLFSLIAAVGVVVVAAFVVVVAFVVVAVVVVVAAAQPLMKRSIRSFDRFLPQLR